MQHHSFFRNLPPLFMTWYTGLLPEYSFKTDSESNVWDDGSTLG